MKVDLVVSGEISEVLEKVEGFLKERGDLYLMVRRSPGRAMVEAEVILSHVRRGRLRAIAAIGAGLVAPETMETIGPDGGIKVVGKPAGENRTWLEATSDRDVKPEAIEPLLAWLRGGLT